MTYQPRPGQYGTLRTKSFFGFFIQLGTECKEDHVVVFAGLVNGIPSILEATPSRGVVLSPLSRYDGCKIAWNRDEFTDIEGAAIVEEGMSHLHDGYSFLAILLIALRILHISGETFLSDRVKKSGKFICSGFAVVLWQNAIGRKISDKPAWLTTPADLMYRNLYI